MEIDVNITIPGSSCSHSMKLNIDDSEFINIPLEDRETYIENIAKEIMLEQATISYRMLTTI